MRATATTEIDRLGEPQALTDPSLVLLGFLS
jgi:hypothetical protein